MKDLGITKGEWVYDESKKAVVSENVKGLLATAWSVYDSENIEVRKEGESWLEMRRRTDGIRENYSKQVESNAKLIADAGTTANKCGLLPSELLEQRDEMLKMLETLNFELTEAIKELQSKDYEIDFQTCYEAHVLIQKITKP